MRAFRKGLTYLTIVGIALVCAVSYMLFVFPNRFAPAGLNGICTMLQYIFGISVGYLNLLINIPLSILTAVLFSAVGFTGTSFEWIQNLSGYSMMFIAILSVSLVILFLNILLYVPIRYILKNKLNLE